MIKKYNLLLLALLFLTAGCYDNICIPSGAGQNSVIMKNINLTASNSDWVSTGINVSPNDSINVTFSGQV